MNTNYTLDQAIELHMRQNWILISRTEHSAQMQYPKKFDWAIMFTLVALVPLTIGTLFWAPFVYLAYFSFIQKNKTILISHNGMQACVNGYPMTSITSTGMTYWDLVSKISPMGWITKKEELGMTPAQVEEVKTYNRNLYLIVYGGMALLFFGCIALSCIFSLLPAGSSY
jgi:hypothetical protein